VRQTSAATPATRASEKRKRAGSSPSRRGSSSEMASGP
jgi:hypothetical protein